MAGIDPEASYWFSKAIDTGSNYTNMAAGDEARQGYAHSQDPAAKDLQVNTQAAGLKLFIWYKRLKIKEQFRESIELVLRSNSATFAEPNFS